jgi:hypothetical protein
MDKPALLAQACLIQLIASKLLPVDGSRDKIRAFDQTKFSKSFPEPPRPQIESKCRTALTTFR